MKQKNTALWLLLLSFALSLLLSGCGQIATDSSFLGRKLSRITGQESVIKLPNTVDRIIWVDFTSGGLFGSTIKNTTFIDKQGEYYTIEIKDYDAFQGLIHWLRPDAKESESWTTKRAFTSRFGGATNIRLPEDCSEILSVSIKANGTKDLTYKSVDGMLKSKEYKDLNPFEGTILWSATEEDRVSQFFFGRNLSRFTGKPIAIKLPDNFEQLIGVDFTEAKNGTVKNVTYKSKEGRYYTLENKDNGLFEGGIEWVMDGRSNAGVNTRIFSRWGFDPVKIHLPPDARELISVSVKANGVKDVVYKGEDGRVKAREYRDIGLLEGTLVFEIQQ